MFKLKKYNLLLFLFIFSIPSNAQNWLTGNGGASNDEALDIASDTAGNYYVTGYFTTQANFGAITLVSSGNSDIFIAKYNSAGVIQWAVSAGGSDADRAYSIKTDNVGNLYITGFYFGSATFGASTINSVSGSQDVFIAKYNTGGNLIWVRTVGGSDAETGNGITVDRIGNVIVTGQFKGTSTFGTTILTSTLDTAGLPSFDIFTTKFDAAGNFLWVEQGRAKFDDRGLDVAVDDANNIFVVGQFSDTIQFDNIHNNPSGSVGYLMKYDGNGNEQWFVKMIAHQTIVNSIAVDLNNNIFITGDYIGNLQIYSNPAISNTGSFFYKIFIAKFNNSGAVLWVDNDGSDNEITSKSIALDNQGNAYIAGLFKCKFGEYSEQYDDGVFYSSGYRDVFVTKYSASGTREWFKQFGSNKDDYCSGIAVKTIDKPVIAGSFENKFHVPYSPAFTFFSSNNPSNNGIGSLCNYSYYGMFITQSTFGQKDIFVTSPVDTSHNQAPFDYFERTGSTCTQNFVKPCIEDCQDTVYNCGPLSADGIYVNHHEIDTYVTGAEYNYTWSTGSRGFLSNPISLSGVYWLKSERKDGCFQNLDSIYVVIYQTEAPWITDSYSINVNQPPLTNPIRVCGEDTLILSGTHTGIAENVEWEGPAHSTVNDSTIKITQSGEYLFKITSPNGCLGRNWVNVIMDTFALHDVLDPHLIFNNATLQATDTIRICPGDIFWAKVIDSAFYSINKDTIPFKYVDWSITSPGGFLDIDSTNYVHTAGISITTTGSYTISNTLYNHCGDSIIYPFSRTFYVIVNPKPIINLSITGSNNACPGDTVTLYATSNVQDFTWTGDNIIQNYHDSIKIKVASGDDALYSINATYTITATGCYSSDDTTFILHPRPYPLVTISPSDGIICPNDSALLTSELGTKYKWIGPAGDSIGNTQSIYVSIPGYYHCIQTSLDGCTQTSNFIEAKEYNTPYLDVLPSNNLCPNASAVVSIQASNLALIEWLPPFAGNSITQTVSAAGTYKCRVTQCGIITLDSVMITQPDVPSFITSTDSIVCPGDVVVLNGNEGMMGYNWVSQGGNESYFYVTEPGTYILETMDANGCTKQSAPFIVSTRPLATEPLVSDTTICSGQIIDILATASDSVLWYNSPERRIAIYTGDLFTTPLIDQDTVFYVQTYAQKNGPLCRSNRVPVYINIFSTSISATTDRDTIPAGESTTIHAITDTSYVVNWMPSESLNNSYSHNPTASPLVSTTYTVSILDMEGCRSIATVFIYVIPMNCEPMDVFVPNTFTPNNDNNNDVLYVRGNEITELYFAVYNRWGQMVFETTDINKGWDGNFKGMPADPAVFDWYLRAKCYSGNSLEKKGNVTLVR